VSRHLDHGMVFKRILSQPCIQSSLPVTLICHHLVIESSCMQGFCGKRILLNPEIQLVGKEGLLGLFI